MNFEQNDKILLLGAGGQLGRELYKVFPQAICRTHRSGEPEDLNLEDSGELERVIFSTRPSLILNAAAKTSVDECESNKKSAYIVNSTAVKHLVDSARKLGCKLVHFSTDYVFDGLKGLYSEDDIPNPVNFYGLSKLIGDAFAQSYERTLIVRTSGVYGSRSNFPNYVYDQLKKKQIVKVIEGYYSPIHAQNLALAVEKLVKNDTYGVINVAGDRISRYDLARLICSRFDLDVDLVNRTDRLETMKAIRPFDSSLDISRAKSMLQFDFHTSNSNLECFEKSIKEVSVHEE